MPAPKNPPAPTNSVVDVQDLERRARAGEPAALAEVERIATAPEFFARVGDFAARVRGKLLDRLGGKWVLERRALEAKVEALRKELEGPAPSAVERLLVERVLIGWLQVQEADGYLAVAREVGLGEVLYYERRAGLAQQRYLAALKGLAAVRKLALPAVQVNVAEHQVNVAG